ncbi:MAG: hypothetical protein CL609_07110 [Anaerolineaceae bacterium]|nr:hypothetical protein [Anaerolineaceae bacterium]
MSESNFETNFESPVPPFRSSEPLGGRNLEWEKRLKRRLRINFDYYLFSAIFFILLATAIFFDELALYILAILFAPLQTPLLVFCFNAAWQPFDRWVNIVFAWVFNFIILFFVGYLLGLVIQQIPNKDIYVWRFFTEFSWANFVLITIGTGLTFFIIQRNPNQNVLVANIAIVYSLNLPLISAGIALAFNEFNLFVQTSLNFLILWLFSVCIGFGLILVSKLSPHKTRVIIFSVLFLGLSLLMLYIKFLPKNPLVADDSSRSIEVVEVWTSTPEILPTKINNSVLTPDLSPTPQPTDTPVVVKSATASVPPTVTPTVTLTPLPTPVWAQIQASGGDGANIRSEPNFSASIVRTVLNGTLIQVLPDTVDTDGNTWVLIRLEDNTEGWIIRDLILSATPAPGW